MKGVEGLLAESQIVGAFYAPEKTENTEAIVPANPS